MITRRGILLLGAGVPLGRVAAKAAATPSIRAVVAPDGSGDFTTIQRAIDHVLDAAPQNSGRVRIEIRPGAYRERLKIPQDRPRLTLAGSDAAKTLVTANMSAAAAGGTFFSPVVEVNGAEFEAENITFENTFGTGSQAVAVSVHSDRAVFRKCTFLGWQDTLYAASGRQYYEDCRVEGHVDFIFGNAAALFERCEIYSRGSGYITAHSRLQADQPTGFVFTNCRLTGAPGLLRSRERVGGEIPFPANDSGKGVFLGRPWRAHSRVVFLNCAMGDHIRPEGWDNWGKAENEKTAWYAEMGSTGPGASPETRVRWARRLTSRKEFETDRFLGGEDHWRPAAR